MFDIFVRMQRRMAADYRQRAAARELAALDDRLLRDLGIHRSEVGSVVTEGTAGRFANRGS